MQRTDHRIRRQSGLRVSLMMIRGVGNFGSFSMRGVAARLELPNNGPCTRTTEILSLLFRAFARSISDLAAVEGFLVSQMICRISARGTASVRPSVQRS